MNYVILNGVKSTEIKGLLIQSLPFVSKPLIRTEVEEIDGKDGDIVTKLGYSAYDKEMSIGLYGDFNIDDVIQYFDSEGTVIFSNEPDKYYKYQITSQIDFERLIRFRTATVTFHVQPFKYSVTDDSVSFNHYFNISDYTETKNGVTLTASDGTISINGTATAATEFYVPVSNVSISEGSYTLTANASGEGITACSIRLITSSPSNANSFGANYLALTDGTATLNGNVSSTIKYNYLWFYITSGTAMNFELDVTLRNQTFESVTVRNSGNIYSKPKITLYGSGTINLSVNNYQLFVIELDGYITIDAAEMNAYKGTNLANRSVTGNYDNFVLPMGDNVITWTGDVKGIDIENYSRWI